MGHYKCIKSAAVVLKGTDGKDVRLSFGDTQELPDSKHVATLVRLKVLEQVQAPAAPKPPKKKEKVAEPTNTNTNN